MNERIRELYTQALEYADSKVPAERRYNDIYYAIASGKHAELIIQECGRYLDSPEFIGRSDLDWSIVLNEHFGVE